MTAAAAGAAAAGGGGGMLGAARIAAAFDIPGFMASGRQLASSALTMGSDAFKAFARGFKDAEGNNNEISYAWSRALKDMERLAGQSGQRAADAFLGGLNAVRSGNPGQSFQVATQAMSSVIETAGQAGQVVTEFASQLKTIGPVAEMAGTALGVTTEAMQLFTETGGQYLGVIAEIGDTYLQLRRTLAASTLDLASVNSQMALTQEIMASGAVDHFEDVSGSIARFARGLNLAGGDLRNFTETYAAMAELVGSISPTNIAGVLNAFEPSTEAERNLYDYSEQLTRFTNIIRATGGNAQSMVDSMIRVGPAMRALGFDSGGTALFFGGLLEKGLRGQKLVYGMNQIVEQMHESVRNGSFKNLEEAYSGLLSTVKALQGAGQGDQAIALLSTYTTPANATLLNEAIQKGIIGDAKEMGKRAAEGFDQSLSDAASETSSLSDIFENVQQQFDAAVAPVGLAFNSFIVEGGGKLVEWLAENQVQVAQWAKNIANFFLEGFEILVGGFGSFLQAFSTWVNPIVEVTVTAIQVVWNAVRLVLDGLGKLSAIPLIGDKFEAFKSVADSMGRVNEHMDKWRQADLSGPFDKAGKALSGLADKLPNVQAALEASVQQYGKTIEVDKALKVAVKVDKAGNPVLGDDGTPELIEAYKPIDQFMRDAQGSTITGANGAPMQNTPWAPMMQLLGDQATWERVKAGLRALNIEISMDASTGIITQVNALTEEARKTWEAWYSSKTKKQIDVYPKPVGPNGEELDTLADVLPGGTAQIEVTLDQTAIDNWTRANGLMVPGAAAQPAPAVAPPGTYAPAPVYGAPSSPTGIAPPINAYAPGASVPLGPASPRVGGVSAEVQWGAAVAADRFGLSLSSGLRPGDGGLHGTGAAGDYSNQGRFGPPTEAMLAFAKEMATKFAPYIDELIFETRDNNGNQVLEPFNMNIKNGQYAGEVALTEAGRGPGQVYSREQAGYHGDHVHIAWKEGALAALKAAGVTLPPGVAAPAPAALPGLAAPAAPVLPAPPTGVPLSPASRPTKASTPQEIAQYIYAQALTHGYSKEDSVAFVAQALGESSLKPTIESPAIHGDTSGTAKGIFQFTPGTWNDFGQGGDVYDPAANIEAYMRLALARDPKVGPIMDRLGKNVSVGGPANRNNPDNANWNNYLAQATALITAQQQYFGLATGQGTGPAPGPLFPGVKEGQGTGPLPGPSNAPVWSDEAKAWAPPGHTWDKSAKKWVPIPGAIQGWDWNAKGNKWVPVKFEPTTKDGKPVTKPEDLIPNIEKPIKVEVETAKPFGPGLNEQYAAQAAAAASEPGKVQAGMDWVKNTYGGATSIPGYIENGKVLPAPGKTSATPNKVTVGGMPTEKLPDGYTRGLFGVPVKQRDMGQDVKDVASGAWNAVKGAWSWLQQNTIVNKMPGKGDDPNDNKWSLGEWVRGKLGLGFAGGGSVTGPGTGTSDSVPAWLSKGEFVHNAAAVNHYGLDFMRAINERRLPGFSDGGEVSWWEKAKGGLKSAGEFMSGGKGGWKEQLSKGVANALSGSFWLEKAGVDTSTAGWNAKNFYMPGVSELSAGAQQLGGLLSGKPVAYADGRISGKELVDFFAMPDAKKEIGVLGSGESSLLDKGMSGLAMTAFIPGLGKATSKIGDVAPHLAHLAGKPHSLSDILKATPGYQRGSIKGVDVKELAQLDSGARDHIIDMTEMMMGAVPSPEFPLRRLGVVDTLTTPKSTQPIYAETQRDLGTILFSKEWFGKGSRSKLAAALESDGELTRDAVPSIFGVTPDFSRVSPYQQIAGHEFGHQFLSPEYSNIAQQEWALRSAFIDLHPELGLPPFSGPGFTGVAPFTTRAQFSDDMERAFRSWVEGIPTYSYAARWSDQLGAASQHVGRLESMDVGNPLSQWLNRTESIGNAVEDLVVHGLGLGDQNSALIGTVKSGLARAGVELGEKFGTNFLPDTGWGKLYDAAGQPIKRATGGEVWGPGTPTSDSIPAWLSNGEFVHNAAAVGYYGKDFMHAVNTRRLPKLAPGGDPTDPNAQYWLIPAGAQGGTFGGAAGLPPQIAALGDPSRGSGAQGSVQGDSRYNPFINPPTGTYEELLGIVKEYVAWQEKIYELNVKAPGELNDKLIEQTAEYERLRAAAAGAAATLADLERQKREALAVPGTNMATLEGMAYGSKGMKAAQAAADVAKKAADQAEQNLINTQEALGKNSSARDIAALEGPPSYKSKKTEGKSDKYAEEFGAGIIQGLFEGLGFPDVFGKSITDWGIWKKGMGLLGYGLQLGQMSGAIPGGNQSGPMINGGLGPGTLPGIVSGAAQTLLPGASGAALPAVAGMVPASTVPSVAPAASVTPAMAASNRSGDPLTTQHGGGGTPGPVANLTLNQYGPSESAGQALVNHGVARMGAAVPALTATGGPG